MKLLLAALLFSPLAQAEVFTFKNAKGEAVGTATITKKDKGVTIALDLKNLPAGPHAFHVNQAGKCLAPSFESAGPHFNPGKSSHGFQSDKGPHAGDFENLTVKEDGTLQAELSNERLALGKGKNSLQKKGGTALVIHEKADDYRSQPAGDAGARIACAEIK